MGWIWLIPSVLGVSFVVSVVTGRLLRRSQTVSVVRYTPAGVIDLRGEAIAVALSDAPPADAWPAIADITGFVGACQPLGGHVHVLFVRRASSRDLAERELVIDLRDACDVDIYEMSTW